MQPLLSALLIAGTILDPSGAPVPSATVRLEMSGTMVNEIHTTSDGHFEFTIDARGDARLIVTAAGFAPAIAQAAVGNRNVEIRLQPSPFFEAVNVTSSRSDMPRSDPAVTMVVFPSSELLTSAAMTIDDALKLVPGFTLFRRTSSRVSNPTAQGITLRGLGGTGASRSLVLADGVPLNDAFGGWVYWDKLPQVAIDRIEVERGSGSDLYGADAVGGVVQILTLRPNRTSARALVEGGGLGTGRASGLAAGHTRGWNYNAAGEWFSTEGYRTVADDEDQDPGIKGAGPIDTKAGSTHLSGLVFVGYQAASGWHVHARGNIFSEDRENGTPAVINRTAARQGSGEVAGSLGGGLLSGRVFGGTQGYDQTFSAVSADRTTEDLNRIQRVPTSFAGAGVQWIRPIGRHSVLVGVEAKFIKGHTQEIRLAQGQILGASDEGGKQQVGSAFAQDTMTVNERLTVVVSGHGDGWHTESQNTSYNKTLGSFNPRASFSYRMGSGFSLRGSAYGGFRAPTLNELYRDFRAGNTQTNHNEALRPERLKGADGGLLMARGNLSARVTGFWNVLDDVITNVTLSTTPALIIKQRQNADRLQSTGVEFEGDVRLPASLSVRFSSAIIDARFKGDTSLQGNRVPQVPEYNVGLSIRYDGRPWTASGQLRITGSQFEDDLNLFTLRRATVLDIFAGRALTRKASLFAAVENIFNSEYDVGRTPILTLGLPRAVRAGVQISLP
ncbi:MAG: TonB-dependent receptor [Vicinamibacterales bacterium]|nr:TonB-dependent receptor [Vicinamibacterales bacterium]